MALEPTGNPTSPEAPARKSGRLVPLIVVAGLMILEGIGVFFLAKVLRAGPASAHAEAVDPESDESAGERGSGGNAGATDGFSEFQVADCKPTNVIAGKLITCHIRVSALVKAADLARAQGLVQARQARLEDCVNTVIRSAEPKHLYEPGLETIKRRLKRELDVIFGDDDLVRQVLIPQLLQSGRGF